MHPGLEVKGLIKFRDHLEKKRDFSEFFRPAAMVHS